MSQSAATPLPSPKERRRLREAKSLSQADIAERVGVTRETVRAWEAARTDPSGRKRDAYAKLLASIAAEHAEATPRRRKARAGAPESKTKATVDGSSARTTRAAQSPGRSTPSAPEPATAKTPRVQETAKAEGTEGTEGTEEADAAGGLTPPQAFDALYAHSATALVQQAYLLTGRRTLAVESVERAFQQAWQRWPEVAVDRDPTGWVRAAAYEYAMSPWHRMRPAQRRPATSAASARAGGEPEPTDSELLDALLSLPPAHRRALVLYDGIGLDLPETAAETEASTPATASRVMRARASVSERVSDLEGPEDLHDRLTALARGEGLTPPEGRVVRTGSDRKVRFWTRAAIAFTVLIIGATGLTVATAPTRYIPDQAPGENVGGVPPRMGPGPLTVQDQQLKKHLTTHPAHVPGRLVPKVE